METPNIDEIKERLLSGWENVIKKSDEDDIAGMGRERIIVFIVSLIIALSLWVMVNLNVDYNLNLEVPIQLDAVPAEQALVNDLPETATVSVSGEGWKLINLYNNPPSINIDVNESQINLYDQVQQQMNAFAVNIQKVQPTALSVQLEERISKKVPVRSLVEVSFEDQFGFVGTPELQPDSVTINGAASLLDTLEVWPTDSVHIEDVSTNLSRAISLQTPEELISLSQSQVIYNADVEEFTEGEVRVSIFTRHLPQGRMISYSPLFLKVKYDIPINEYAEVQDINPFQAYVTYRQIVEDSTGYVTPQIEQTTDEYHIKLRSFQPRRIAYYTVLGE